MKKTIVLLLTFLVLGAIPAVADVIVQKKEAHRTWNSRDTVTMNMSDKAFEKWRSRYLRTTERTNARYVKVGTGERYNSVKRYAWITIR